MELQSNLQSKPENLISTSLLLPISDHGEKRALNLDDDLVEELHERCAEIGADSLAALSRACGAVMDKTAYNLMDRKLLKYMAEGWLIGHHMGDLSVAPDGTRVGNPAEDTVSTIIFAHAVRRGMIAPGQVNSAKYVKSP